MKRLKLLPYFVLGLLLSAVFLDRLIIFAMQPDYITPVRRSCGFHEH